MSTTVSQAQEQLVATARAGRLLGVSRTRAFLTHLAFSAVIVAITCAVNFFVWYPHPYFQAGGAWHALRVLIGVDVVIGPMLTLIVFKAGKKGLKFDLAFIAIVQLAAFIYGVSVLYSHRPYFSVFAVDRFVLVAQDEVDARELAGAGNRVGSKPFVGPLQIVARRPTDEAGMQRLLDETLFQGKPDIDRRPEFWWPYAEHAAEVAAKARPIASIRGKGPEIAALVDGLPARLGVPESRLGVLPLLVGDHPYSVVIDKATALPLEVFDVDPWSDN